ncbi:unnamed protein product [Paramecium octaurelia]|uniref:Uncharacterized protein n=1 Tax=Paramecium octaurelia TaxID=43137 RepID=A0A8S1TYH2_PAROT|nr:unnamed protein product [Paramecium octaurelia]
MEASTKQVDTSIFDTSLLPKNKNSEFSEILKFIVLNSQLRIIESNYQSLTIVEFNYKELNQQQLKMDLSNKNIEFVQNALLEKQRETHYQQIREFAHINGSSE